MRIAPVRVGDEVDVPGVAPLPRRGVEIRRFRLFVSICDGERVPCSPVFTTAKAAIARVSDVVRQCAEVGVPHTVELQVLTTAGGEWKTVEVWGPEVVARIGAQFAQPGHRDVESICRPSAATRLQGLIALHAATEPPVFDWPEDTQGGAADGPVKPQTAAEARRPKRQRWRLIGTAGLLVIVWTGLMYWMTGGEVAALWSGPTATAAISEELRWAREGAAHELAVPAGERLAAE